MFKVPTIGKVEAENAFYCRCPDDVQLFASPWVAGCRAAAYKGPVEVQLTVDSLPEAFYYLDDQMRERAFYFDCNAVVGYECHIHPWEDPMVCVACGTLAILEPL